MTHPSLNRRSTLALLATSGLSLLAIRIPQAIAAATPTSMCVLTPAQTEGPFFVDAKLNRSDIRSDPATGAVKDGTPLRLVMNVSRMGAGACAALPGATVDVWHCDAQGAYSDAQDARSELGGGSSSAATR